MDSFIANFIPDEVFFEDPDKVASKEGIERLCRLERSHIKALIAKSDTFKEAIKALMDSEKCSWPLKRKLALALNI